MTFDLWLNILFIVLFSFSIGTIATENSLTLKKRLVLVLFTLGLVGSIGTITIKIDKAVIQARIDEVKKMQAALEAEHRK